jgi:putative RecB family exonuclease
MTTETTATAPDGTTTIYHNRSHSQLTEWTGCGMRYKLHRIDRLPEIPALWLFSGSAYHEAIEAWEKSERQMGTDEAQDVYTDSLDAYVADAMTGDFPLSQWLSGGRGGPQHDLNQRYVNGRQWVAGYIERAQANPHESIWHIDGAPAIEVPFSITIDVVDALGDPTGEAIRVNGVIDQVLSYDGGITPSRIRDLKTGSKEPAGFRQLAIYRLGLVAETGWLVEHGDYFLARKETHTLPVALSWYDFPALEAEFRALEKALSEQVFIPNPGDHCRVCGVKYACPLMTMKGQPDDGREAA